MIQWRRWEKNLLFFVLVVLTVMSTVGVVQSVYNHMDICEVVRNRAEGRQFLIEDVYAPLPLPDSGNLAYINSIVEENQRRGRRLAKYEKKFPVVLCGD